MDTALDVARRLVTDAEAVVAEWSAKAANARDAIARLEDSIGRDALTEPTRADDAVDEIARLRTAATIADRAVDEATNDVDEARRALLRTAANHVRSRARQLRDDAEARDQAVGEILDELERVDGCRYAPTVTVRDFQGTRTEIARPGADRMRSEAQALDLLVVEIEAMVPKDFSDEILAQLLRKADPDGPEAEARAAKVVAERLAADEVREREQAANVARNEWIAHRATQIERSSARHNADQARAIAAEEFRVARREHGTIPAALEALNTPAGTDLVSA